MKTVVLYDSNFGNTKLVAEEISKNIDGSSKAISVKELNHDELGDIDLLILGSPINGWNSTKNIQEFLQANKDNIKKGLNFTTFDTRVKMFIHGDAKDKMAKTLKSFGATLIIEPEAFYVEGNEGPLFDGELKRAKEWADKIKNKIKK